MLTCEVKIGNFKFSILVFNYNFVYLSRKKNVGSDSEENFGI